MTLTSTKTVSTCAALCLAVAALTGCSSSDDDARDVGIEIVESTDSFQGDTFTSEHLKIELTEQQVIPAGSAGNENGELPVLAIWYEVTNTSTRQMDALTSWFTHFQVYQNLGADSDEAKYSALSMAISPDEGLTKHETDLIKEGATQRSVIAYQLLRPEAPVEISVTDTSLKELGRLRVDVG